MSALNTEIIALTFSLISFIGLVTLGYLLLSSNKKIKEQKLIFDTEREEAKKKWKEITRLSGYTRTNFKDIKILTKRSIGAPSKEKWDELCGKFNQLSMDTVGLLEKLKSEQGKISSDLYELIGRVKSSDNTEYLNQLQIQIDNLINADANLSKTIQELSSKALNSEYIVSEFESRKLEIEAIQVRCKTLQADLLIGLKSLRDQKKDISDIRDTVRENASTESPQIPTETLDSHANHIQNLLSRIAKLENVSHPEIRTEITTDKVDDRGYEDSNDDFAVEDQGEIIVQKPVADSTIITKSNTEGVQGVKIDPETGKTITTIGGGELFQKAITPKKLRGRYYCA